MINAIIVDDEIKSGELTGLKLQKYCPQVKVLAVFNEPEKALVYLANHNNVDVVFLDIEMPRITGLQLAGKIERNLEIVFTTAYQRYSIDAIRLTAFDYLLKPIDESEIKNCVIRLEEKLFRKKSYENIKNIDTFFDKIALPATEGIHFIEINEIVLVEADSNYSIFHFMNRKKMVFSKTLKQIEKAIEGYTFFRAHKSYLINLNYIVKYSKGNAGTISMQNGMEIELSRSHKKEFLTLFEMI